MHMFWRGSTPVRPTWIGARPVPAMSLSGGTHKHTAGVSFDPYMSLPTSAMLDRCIGMDPFVCFAERNLAPNRIGVRYNREDPEENAPADLIKLPLIRNCGNSEGRHATTPAEQPNATPNCQPIVSPHIPFV